MYSDHNDNPQPHLHYTVATKVDALLILGLNMNHFERLFTPSEIVKTTSVQKRFMVLHYLHRPSMLIVIVIIRAFRKSPTHFHTFRKRWPVAPPANRFFFITHELSILGCSVTRTAFKSPLKLGQTWTSENKLHNPSHSTGT